MPEPSPCGRYLQVSEPLLDAHEVRAGGLSTEKGLCDRFGASRTAVRSARAQLEGQEPIGKRATRGQVSPALPVAQEGQTA